MPLPLSIWTTGLPVPLAEAARGKFYRMIQPGLALGFGGEITDVDCEQVERLPSPDEVCGVVVSGSPARLGTRDPWMLRTMEALRELHEAQVPILGICFGHQLLGQALGGQTLPNPRGREIGTVPLRLRVDDPLLGAAGESQMVVMTHLDSVVTRPPDAVVLGTTELEPHAGLRFSETTWGVQFHPEMDTEILGYYIEDRRDDLVQEGFDPDALLAGRQGSAYGKGLLARFGELCSERALRRF